MLKKILKGVCAFALMSSFAFPLNADEPNSAEKIIRSYRIENPENALGPSDGLTAKVLGDAYAWEIDHFKYVDEGRLVVKMKKPINDKKGKDIRITASEKYQNYTVYVKNCFLAPWFHADIGNGNSEIEIPMNQIRYIKIITFTHTPLYIDSIEEIE